MRGLPHRAEGFGYILAYAMILGTPVVATDYSGSSDFLLPSTGYPVRAREVPVPRGHGILPMENAVWADVSVEAMAKALTEVAENPDNAASRAKIAADMMASRYSMAAQTLRYRARLEILHGLSSNEGQRATKARSRRVS